VREQERIRLAREVHDELGQALTGLKMDLAWIQRRLAEAQGQQERGWLTGRLAAMTALVDSTLAAVRRIATELRPGVLDELGLAAALEWLVEGFERRTGIRCHLLLGPGDLRHLERGRATAVFRIAQEALTNVARHAEATEVRVRLCVDAADVSLEVADNGKGIDRTGGPPGPASLGLLGMRERAAHFGGELTVLGAPGAGTRLTARLPQEPAAQGRADRAGRKAEGGPS
jgi:signal transduction histidine kinase